MKVLGIESAAETASVALLTDGILTAEYTLNDKRTHSQTLMPMLDAICGMVNLDKKTLDAVAVSAGPGSFTGLRIGGAAAKGLGMALQIPLVPVPTLAALAYNLWGSSALICPVMDARRGRLYQALYRCEEELSVVSPARTVDAEELLRELAAAGERVIFAGGGVSVLRPLLERGGGLRWAFAPAHACRHRAGSVAALGAELLKKGGGRPGRGLPAGVSEAEPGGEGARAGRPPLGGKGAGRRNRAAHPRGGGRCSGMRIREMEEGDIPAVCALERECFSDAWSERLVRAAFESELDSCFLLVEESGDALGYVNIRVLGDEAELMRICLAKRARGRGLSALLLRRGLEEMKRRGAAAATLEVRAGNMPAVRLYRAHGFLPEGVRRDYYRNPTEDAEIYWKRGL